MKAMVAVALIGALLISPISNAIYGDEENIVYQHQRMGYSVLWQGYTVVTTCTPDDPIEAGGHVLICNSYSYPYHDGNATLMSKAFQYKGKAVDMHILCLDGREQCESIQEIK
mgnify:CR=1 FL=1